MLGKAAGWVSCPLGLNLLLALQKNCGGHAEKYLQINELLKNETECVIDNKIFAKPTANIDKLNNTCVTADSVVHDEPFTAFLKWAKNHSKTEILNNKSEINNGYILANFTSFKDKWRSRENKAPEMKIYNSFKYTQDVHYEARILELPLHNKLFKLIIIVPNESDVVHSLFAKFTSRGYDEAISSIQPLFTVDSELKSPRIFIDRSVRMEQNENCPRQVVQCGFVDVNETGVNINVVTCLNIKLDVEPTDTVSSKSTFYFGLVFKDLPIFTGMYLQ